MKKLDVSVLDVKVSVRLRVARALVAPCAWLYFANCVGFDPDTTRNLLVSMPLAVAIDTARIRFSGQHPAAGDRRIHIASCGDRMIIGLKDTTDTTCVATHILPIK